MTGTYYRAHFLHKVDSGTFQFWMGLGSSASLNGRKMSRPATGRWQRSSTLVYIPDGSQRRPAPIWRIGGEARVDVHLAR